MRIGVPGQQVRLQLNQAGPESKEMQRMLEQRGALETSHHFILQMRKQGPQREKYPSHRHQIRNRASCRNGAFHVVAECVGDGTDLHGVPAWLH